MKNMMEIKFEQRIFLKEIDLDKKFYDAVDKIKLHEKEEQFTNFQNVDKETIEKKQFFFDYLSSFFLEAGKKLNYNGFKVKDFWFQKYTKPNMNIGVHIHNNKKNDYSFVLYIDCTDKSSETVFYPPGYPYVISDKIEIDPKKKLCVLFPGFLPHEAKPNNDKSRFIMSGNISFV